ncbi:MAG: MarR family transcriptional regulator [Planctomycetota bacterium]
MKLRQNTWSVWGFSGNPFDTKALSINSKLLPISKAYVGRSMDSLEAKQLFRLISNPGGGCCIVEGDIGVGKTTFVNYHRYLWENEAEDRLLTTLREIPVYTHWEAKDFLMEILGQLSNKLLFLLNAKKGKPSKFLKKIQLLNQIFYHESLELQGSMLGFGIGYSSQPQVNVPYMTESQLMDYLFELLEETKKLGFQGIFLHFDNLELLAQEDIKDCQYLFEQIRDILQIPDIYYVFICRAGLFGQVLGNSERVRSIMGWPIKVPPLTEQEVIEVINTRYNLLSITPEKYIQPVNDRFIKFLYNLYNGKIRFIMDSIAQVCLYWDLKETGTLSEEEAKKAFYNIIKLKTDRLTSREYQCLMLITQLGEFSNEDIKNNLGMQAPNVSKILKRLAQENLIYYLRRDSKKIYYKVVDEIKVLLEFEETAEKKIKKVSLGIVPLKMLDKLEDRLEKLTKYLEERGKITNSEYQKLTGVSANTGRLDMKVLIQQGILKKFGEKKGTYYIKVKPN